ncbi:hypothetical protein VIGAN_02122600, partial [Vigna angularis var. angularis]
STRKNDVIYSEIGLDVSPSSSLDDSPSESEGISCDPHEAPFESPTIILQVNYHYPFEAPFGIFIILYYIHY